MCAKRRKSERSTWRASWKGDFRLGLVSFSVEAVNAHSRSGSDIHFHQLHDECHSRIEYQKTCPLHGKVEQDEIVLGYEYGRGKYVEIDPDELDQARTKEERALTVEQFIPREDLDPIYFDGRMYYLAPREAHDREPYQLVRQVLEDQECVGIGQVVFSGKQQLVAILPRQGALLMAMLNYAAEIRDESQLAVGERVKLGTQNLRMAKELVHSMLTSRFSIESYEDKFRDRVKQIIAAKRRGKTIEIPEEEDEGDVINLMDALKKSLAHGATKKRRKTSSRRRRA